MNNVIIKCTQNNCYSNNNPKCLDNNNNNIDKQNIPMNCATWFDGCNTCSVINGVIQLCTLMMCITEEDPYCQTFTYAPLLEGDICYRFCEDNSQNTINRIDQCPEGTTCSLNNKIGIDNCGGNALKCITNTGH